MFYLDHMFFASSLNKNIVTKCTDKEYNTILLIDQKKSFIPKLFTM